MEARDLRVEQDALGKVLRSPDWQVFRQFCERALRSLWFRAVNADNDPSRLEALAESKGISSLLAEFEMEEARLEEWLAIKKIGGDKDDAIEAMEDLKRARGVARPYKE